MMNREHLAMLTQGEPGQSWWLPEPCSRVTFGRAPSKVSPACTPVSA